MSQRRLDESSQRRLDWKELNDLAAQHLHTLLRTLKLCNKKIGKQPVHERLPLGLWQHVDTVLVDMIDHPCIPLASFAQIKIVRPDLSFNELRVVEYVWGSLNVHMLPAHVLEAQMELLKKLGSCQMYQRSFTIIRACIKCALRTKTSLLAQTFAYNCRTRTLHCASCSKEAIRINLLGRVLRVKGVSYYLCPQCLAPVTWNGSTLHCCAPPQLVRDVSTCITCSKKSVEVIRKVIDVDKLCIVPVGLCYQHAKHCILSACTVYDLTTLTKELHSGLQ